MNTSEYTLHNAISFYDESNEKIAVKARIHKRAILARLLSESALSAEEANDIRTVELDALGVRLDGHFADMKDSSKRVYIGRAKRAIAEFLQYSCDR